MCECVCLAQGKAARLRLRYAAPMSHARITRCGGASLDSSILPHFQPKIIRSNIVQSPQNPFTDGRPQSHTTCSRFDVLFSALAPLSALGAWRMDHCPHPQRPASTPPRVASSAAKASVASGPCRRRCVRCAMRFVASTAPSASSCRTRAAWRATISPRNAPFSPGSAPASAWSASECMSRPSPRSCFWIVLTLGVVGQCRDTAVPASVARRNTRRTQWRCVPRL